jgi:hypothetical protein
MINKILNVLFFLYLLSLGACTKDDFARTTVTTDEKVEEIKVEEVVGCSLYSPPPLDILILYDNSTSLYYFKRNIKAAIRQLGTKLTNFEDYRICIAPLVYQGDQNNEYRCQSYVQTKPKDSSASTIPEGLNDITIDGITTNIYTERGMERAYNIITKNKFVGGEFDPVFRQQAVTVAIVVSNGDDTDICRDSWGNINECGKINYWSNKFISLKSAQEMELKQVRFISVVNTKISSTCGGTARYPGERYSLLSKVVYQGQGLTTDPRVNKDSYDLCNGDLTNIFDQIAKSINDYKVGHKYAVWPLGKMTGKDPQKLEVWKGKNKIKLQLGDLTNGFNYDPSLTPKNIRESPAVSDISPAEIHSGPFINLFGSGKVTYPECLYIKKEDFTKYYGYIVMHDEPDITTLKIIIDGKEIPVGGPNGWDFLGFKPSQYLLVKSPKDLSPGPVPDEDPQKYFKAGYVIQLSGSAVYQDGAKLEILYKKAKLK